MTRTQGENAVAERLARRPWPAQPIRPDVNVSFEFFPANSAEGADKLLSCAAELASLGPEFVSVTYGAGGTTQDRTHSTICDISSVTSVPVAGHLTCVGATKDEIHAVIEDYFEAGVRHIVALRGDPQPGDTDGTLANGYRSASELVAGIRERADQLGVSNVQVSVAAYPEVHPKAASATADMDNLKQKLDAGADRALTQFFFDTDAFVRFLHNARSAGIDAPIVPGIMPVTNFSGVVRFSERCGTTVPSWMHDLFAGLEDAPEVRQLVAATVAAEQCRRLREHGVTDFHFYTMNRAELTSATCRILGIRPPATVADQVAVSRIS